MAKNYEVGEKYYLPVTVKEINPGYQYPIDLEFTDCDSRDTTDEIRITDDPDLLLTAEEIAADIHFRKNREKEARFEELERENQELKNENGKLTAKVDDLEAELTNARHVNEYAVETAQNKEKLIAEQRELIKKYGMVIDILLDKITALKKGENNG
jgi:cell division protein FtsB